MRSAKISKASFAERLEKMGGSVIIDEARVANVMDEYTSSPNALRKGQYHFFENLEEMDGQHGAFYRATAAFKNSHTKSATTGKYNISSFFSSYSNFETPNGEIVNAKVSFNIDEGNKQEKINKLLINRAIEVIEDYGKNSVKWRFITKDIFVEDSGFVCSGEFLEYWENKIYERIII